MDTPDLSAVDYFTVAFSLPPLPTEPLASETLFELLGRSAERSGERNAERNARKPQGPRLPLLDQAADELGDTAEPGP